jgi:hypothetical protein
VPELNDDYLRAALRGLRDSALPAIRQPSLDEVEHLARRRQSTNTAGLVSLMVLLLIGAIAIANLTKPPPPIEPGPTPTATPTPIPVTTTPATQGAGELANATIAMPFDPAYEGPCPDQPLTYTNGQHDGSHTVAGGGTASWSARILATVRADVDHDGTDEVIVKADCTVGNDRAQWVVALRPFGDGGWVTLGVIVTEGPDSVAIGDLAATSEGEVMITVGNYVSSGDTGVPPAVWPQRTYAWTGRGFAQAAGPTSFAGDANVASFAVTAPPVTLADGPGKFRSGTLTVTVRADGPHAVAAAVLIIASADRQPGGDWRRCGSDSDANWVLCDLGLLAVGESVTLSLPVQVDPDVRLPGGILGGVSVRTDQFEYEPVAIRVADP